VAMRIAFMRQAIALGLHGMRIGEGAPFGAVVVKRGKVFAAGWNRVLATNDPTAHAEVVAIRRACERLGSPELTDCDLYVSCEPCPMCLGAIYWARPRALYFASTAAEAAAVGFDDSFIFQELNRPYADRSIPFVQVHVEDSTAGLREWIGRSATIRKSRA
jgi:guanine deaminase